MLTSLVICILMITTAYCSTATTCLASVTAAQKSTWTSNSVVYVQYEISIQNTGSCTLTSVSATLADSAHISQCWNYDNVTKSFSLFGGLAAGATINSAGLVVTGTSLAAASVSVQNLQVVCSSDCGSSSTPTPPASAPLYAGQELVSKELAADLKTAATTLDRLALLYDGATTFDYYTATTQVDAQPAGKKVQANAKNWPGIIGLGMSTIYIYLGACGLNLPHLHPRATTITTVLTGTIMTGFFMENGEHFRMQNVSKGMSTVIPQGAQHFEQNLGCSPVEFVATFNSEDPGVQTIVPSFFSLPEAVVIPALGEPVSDAQFQAIKSALPAHIILGMEECRTKCGL